MTDTKTDDCKPTCGCKANADVDALGGALFATGRAKNPTEARQSAEAVLWALREYGWKITRR